MTERNYCSPEMLIEFCKTLPKNTIIAMEGSGPIRYADYITNSDGNPLIYLNNGDDVHSKQYFDFKQ